MITRDAPVRFDVQWSAHARDDEGTTMWHTDTAWESELDAVIAMGRSIEENRDLSHRIVKTERTVLVTVEGEINE